MNSESQEPLNEPSAKPYRPYASEADRRARRAAIPADKPLTRRERVVIAEYAKDLNLTQAMVRSGRGGKHPDRRAFEFQQRGNVASALEAVVTQREKSSEVSVERLVQRYSEYAFTQGTGPVLHSHVLQALEMLAKWKRMTAPETQVVVPVQFVFIGAPDISQEPSKTLESSVKTMEPLVIPAGK